MRINISKLEKGVWGLGFGVGAHVVKQESEGSTPVKVK